jgi:apolipoprotein N-acyltransferase
VENRRWVLRAANNGITATIDPGGRVRHRLPLGERATLDTRFSFVQEQTFYTRYGDWFPLACAIVALAALIVTRRRTTV